LAVANLTWANAGANQLAGTPVERVQLAPEMRAVIEAVAERPHSANGLPGRVYNEYRVYDDYGIRAQVEDVWGSSPLRVMRYATLFENFPLDRMWRLLGVEHILTWRRDLFGPSTLLAEFAQATDTTYLHRLPAANPRAWLVPQVLVAGDTEAWQLLADHQFDLEQRAILGPEASDFAGVENDSPISATVSLERRTAEEFQVRVSSEQAGLLVVSETWLPGWEIGQRSCSGHACPTQDEQARPYFLPMRANLTLLGIWLPAGVSTFVLRYDPPSVQQGLWIRGATLLLLLGAVAWHGILRR
jgi:hypothetical protein